MPRTALALAALSATAFFLSGCIFVDVDRGGHYRRPPPGYYGDGYYRGGPDRRW